VQHVLPAALTCLTFVNEDRWLDTSGVTVATQEHCMQGLSTESHHKQLCNLTAMQHPAANNHLTSALRTHSC
jgi:hypothetical protein